MGQITAALAQIPTDWFVIFVGFVLISFETFRAGAGRACALALAFPVSAVLLDAVTGAVVAGGVANAFATPVLRAVLFGALFVLAYTLVHQIGVFYGSEAGRPFLALLSGFACMAIVVVFWVHTPALTAVWKFGGSISALVGDSYRFWWLAGSYGILAFVRR